MMSKLKLLHPLAKRTAVAVVVTLAGLFLAGNLRAGDTNRLMAEIPFDFVVGAEMFPAGTYQVEVGPGAVNPPVLAIQTAPESADELRFKKVFAATKVTDISEGKPRLVFERVGKLYFLDEVVPASGPAEKVVD